MRKFILLTIFSCFSWSMTAQSGSNLHPCGTENFRSDWLKKFQQNIDKYSDKSGEIIYIPLNVAIVGTNFGTGFFSESTVLESLCTLAEDFSETDMVFYLKDIRWIEDSDFFEHETVIDGAYKMFEYNDDLAINCYIVGSPAGNCGYNLPYAGIALATSCTSPTDHTWAHELGHAFSLPHPFLGWEGGISYDGAGTHNYNDPAPEYVLYDYTSFKDSLIVDTLIIDTAYVELMDGSNCEFAADGFCDTAPDYLAQRWACDSEGLSFTEQTDPTGEKFRSDASLFMSYGFDACANRFTEDQSLAMYNNALEKKSELVETINPSLSIPSDQEYTLNPPFDSELDAKEIIFSWEPIENAEFYLLQVGLGESLNLVLYDTIVRSPEVFVADLPTNFDLFWKVVSFNSTEFCQAVSSDIIEYIPTDVSSVPTLETAEVKVIPSLFTGSQTLKLVTDKVTFSAYSIFNSSGMLVANGNITASQTIEMDGSLDSGLYFMELTDGRSKYLERIMKF